MKTTIGELNQKIDPLIQRLLDVNSESVKTAINAINKQTDEQNQTNGVIEISEKIQEYEEELKIIELNRTIRKLRNGIKNTEIEIDPIEVDFPVPKPLSGIFKKSKKKK